MSDITITLTEDEAREVLSFMVSNGVADKIRVALPPEYPEGTVAWVKDADRNGRDLGGLCEWRGGQWYDSGKVRVIGKHEKVEPLRVLADDEIAVKRGFIQGWQFRADADALDKHHGHADCSTSHWLRRIADALDAEARP